MCASVEMCRYACVHPCFEISLVASMCVRVCVCMYLGACAFVQGHAAILHGDSIPRLWLSTGLSLAVTSHHLLVIETADERPAYEQ